jgi:hypothetical protein
MGEDTDKSNNGGDEQLTFSLHKSACAPGVFFTIFIQGSYAKSPSPGLESQSGKFLPGKAPSKYSTEFVGACNTHIQCLQQDL